MFLLADQKNVLAKEAHQISLDRGVLKMTVRLPTEETAAPVSGSKSQQEKFFKKESHSRKYEQR